MENKHTGIVKNAAPSTSGIKLEGEDFYWNVMGKAKEYVKPELKGKSVELTVIDKEAKKVSFVAVKGNTSLTGNSSPGTNTKDGYWKKKLDLDNARDKRVSRHGAFNTALEAVKHLTEPKQLSEEDLLSMTERIAEKVLNFVNRE